MNTNSFLPDLGIVSLIVGIVIYIGVFLVGILILWAIIRSAVRRALRDHQMWLESRGRL